MAKAVVSRAEKIQQLRSMYQQRHRQRQGVYPLDDAEEHYERQIQQMEQRVGCKILIIFHPGFINMCVIRLDDFTKSS